MTDYKLFLDDERIPANVTWVPEVFSSPFDWVVVRSFNEFVKQIEENGLPSVISFDHDLAIEHYNEGLAGLPPRKDYKEKTGYDCAKWLVEYCMDNKKKIPEFYVHSMNPVGRENIKCLLMQANMML